MLNKYAEFLVNETGMPYDYVERAVSDFGYQMEMARKFYKWKGENYPDIPFK